MLRLFITEWKFEKNDNYVIRMLRLFMTEWKFAKTTVSLCTSKMASMYSASAWKHGI